MLPKYIALFCISHSCLLFAEETALTQTALLYSGQVQHSADANKHDTSYFGMSYGFHQQMWSASLQLDSTEGGSDALGDWTQYDVVFSGVYHDGPSDWKTALHSMYDTDAGYIGTAFGFGYLHTEDLWGCDLYYSHHIDLAQSHVIQVSPFCMYSQVYGPGLLTVSAAVDAIHTENDAYFSYHGRMTFAYDWWSAGFYLSGGERQYACDANGSICYNTDDLYQESFGLFSTITVSETWSISAYGYRSHLEEAETGNRIQADKIGMTLGMTF